MAISDVNELLAMDRRGLAATWTLLYRGRTPPAVGDAILRLALAYRMQCANTAADIRPALEKQLQQVLKASAGRPSTKAVRFQRYLREWNGEMHVVEAVANGYAYKNAEYRSLSEVARKITGTRWSGPLFFGVKKRTATAQREATA
jgi:hypothetical protein